MDDHIVSVLLVTANVGSLFEDRENKEDIWISHLVETLARYEPSFVALHFQECGGKVTTEQAFASVEDFTRVLLSNVEIRRRFDRRFAWIDQDFKKLELYTALGCVYLIKKSLKNVSLWSFKESRFEMMEGEKVQVGDLTSIPFVQKLKFPQEFFPESKWSRKGFMRTKWKVNNSVFDLVNIHLFHDASNIEAIKMSPSVYSRNRHRALQHILDKLDNGCLPKAPTILFGDFNFRLDTKAVVESLCAGLQSQHIRKDGESNTSKIIFRDKKNSDKVVLALETRKFTANDQSHFHTENAKRFLKYNKELDEFKHRLYEYNICFQPSYPFSDNIREGMAYNNSRCPSWCDRVFLSHSAKDIILEGNNHCVTYNLIGRKVCMGDHKPVFLNFHLDSSKDAIEVTQQLD